ncbi:DEAD/DEAH box helicase, partial [Streptomyces sp. NPDC054833]
MAGSGEDAGRTRGTLAALLVDASTRALDAADGRGGGGVRRRSQGAGGGRPRPATAAARARD